MKKTLNIECPCGHWNRITFNTVFSEPPLPEPKVRMMKRMYKPLEETKCAKCGGVTAKPEELLKSCKVKEQYDAVSSRVVDNLSGLTGYLFTFAFQSELCASLFDRAS